MAHVVRHSHTFLDVYNEPYHVSRHNTANIVQIKQIKQYESP